MFNVLNDIRLSKNFHLSEFVCKDGSEKVKIDHQLIYRLQLLRDKIGKPVRITSGYRTEQWNKDVGGVPSSQHLLGKAADIQVDGITPENLAAVAADVGFDGIGIYKNFLHVDVRGQYARWNG